MNGKASLGRMFFASLASHIHGCLMHAGRYPHTSLSSRALVPAAAADRTISTAKNFFFRPADRSACLCLTHSALGVIPPPPSPPPPSLTLSVVAVRQPADPPDARSPCSVHIQHLRLLDHPVTVLYPNHHTRPSLPRLLRASHSTALSHGG